MRGRIWALAILAVASAVVATTVTASAQGRIVARHGDWQIRCETPVGSPSEQCALVQNVEAQDRANVGLTVIFLRTADRQARILRVLAPLGVLLPSGLGLSIDSNEVGLAGFVRCLPEGCIAEVELDDGLLERFGAGTTATFVIFQTPEAGIGIPISLAGFTDGFAALENPPPAASITDAAPAAPLGAVATTVEAPSSSAAQDELPFESEADNRTELDRLLEDPLLPYVAAGLFMIVAIVVVVVLVLRSRRRRPFNPPQDAFQDEYGEEYPVEDDGLQSLETAPVRKRSDRTAPQLAQGSRPRQIPTLGDDVDTRPPASHNPTLPRPPRAS